MIRKVRSVLPILLVALLLASDLVALREIRQSFEWILGSNALLAAISMLFLANAVTMAFFFEGLSKRSIRLLHGIAFLLYTIVCLAIYMAGVDNGMRMFPSHVAEDAFGLSQLAAVRLSAIAISVAIAGCSAGFWSVMGTLINHHTNREQTVRWQAGAANADMNTSNILDLAERGKHTGS